MKPVPAQNRVTPWGDIVASSVRGAWMGNRGRLHEGSGTRVVVRQHQTMLWITCRLSFKDRRTPQWEPHTYTPLFFLDEAVALAAGHRPCAECRRSDFLDYQRLWAEATGEPKPRAPDMDRVLHGERRPVGRGSRPTWRLPWRDVPNATFVVIDGSPAVVVNDRLARWDSATGRYGEWLRRPDAGDAAVLTPASTVAVLSAGYVPQLDSAAGGPSSRPILHRGAHHL